MAYKVQLPPGTNYYNPNPNIPAGTIIDDDGNVYLNDVNFSSMSYNVSNPTIGTTKAFSTGISGPSLPFAAADRPSVWTTSLQSFPFSISSGTSSQVAHVSEGFGGHHQIYNRGGQFNSETKGYVFGGLVSGEPLGYRYNRKNSFPYAVSEADYLIGSNVVTPSFKSDELYTESFYAHIGFSSKERGYHFMLRENTFPKSPSSGDSTDLYDQHTVLAYPFASDTFSFAVGELNTNPVYGSGGSVSSDTHGFSSGGFSFPPTVYSSSINKFSFSEGNIDNVEVGELNPILATDGPGSGGAIGAFYARNGSASPTHGYMMISALGATTPGYMPHSDESSISKFPFSISSGTAAIVGNYLRDPGGIANNHVGATGAMTSDGSDAFITDGYIIGAGAPGYYYKSTINKFPFSTEGDTVEVGELNNIINDPDLASSPIVQANTISLGQNHYLYAD